MYFLKRVQQKVGIPSSLLWNKISSSCGNVTYRGILDQEEKNIIVQIHNELRAKIANGLESRGSPGPQPSAANMIELAWDGELALEAQTWADQCITDHDCPSCRKLSRFSVGQNLYSFGHIPGIFEGSWKRAISGWYDEVVDFKNNHVDPFKIRKGVLVGHFTQVAWATTSKIGCGRLTYFSEESKTLGYGQQLYICNYGRAGNYIGSKLYKIGTPCSKCPKGSECSSNYPGLCTLDPNLSVIPIDIPTLPPPTVSIFGSNATSFQVTKPPEDENARCNYECKNNLGCSVSIQTTGIVNGPTLGSCFPPFFGGKCSGTPKDCLNCSSICIDSNVGMKVSIAVKRANDIRKTPLQNKESSSKGPDSKTCHYTCKPTGGCSVRLKSSSPLSGNVLGSCFSPVFGGECFGTPKDCGSCLEKCEKNGGESFKESV
ncbi:uncharacterized protein [Lepeophtheirus salmonis]|uniref:uncharacterized protein isoform X2 n=1 Tax=Lepeophtheirus salmonis TaxID=72036 RepID=UPI001AEB68F6|nr:CRISP/Allergen/PR-1-like isoform X2 [Lepeophtheirus salmonis]